MVGKKDVPKGISVRVIAGKSSTSLPARFFFSFFPSLPQSHSVRATMAVTGPLIIAYEVPLWEGSRVRM
jgi:hypothetical protein